MFGLFFTTVTLGLDPGGSSLSCSGAFFFIVILGRFLFIVILGRFLFIVILGRNTSRGSPLQIPVSSTGMTNKELSLPRLFFLCHIRAAPNISFVDSPVKHTLSVIVGLDPAI